jgi:hypothetical protein
MKKKKIPFLLLLLAFLLSKMIGAFEAEEVDGGILSIGSCVE